MDIVHAGIAAGQRELLRLIVEADGSDEWMDDGARDLAHWISMRYGISGWKARRWIAAAHALERLPEISRALECGTLSLDKVVELTRFATPETEADLVTWATRVSGSWIRRRADLMERQVLAEAQQAIAERSVRWWYMGQRFHLELDAPRSDGPRILKQLHREAEAIPVMPGEEGSPARLADAAVALLTSTSDGARQQATVLITARLDDLVSGENACSMEGEAIHPETARRYACHSRFQLLLQDDRGEPLKLGRLRRDPSPSMRRLVFERDRCCTFPGCGTGRYLEIHHVDWWGRGGTTDIERLAALCSFHHQLPHERGWRMVRTEHGGEVRWYRPDGTRYRAGPAPPSGELEEPSDAYGVDFADTG